MTLMRTIRSAHPQGSLRLSLVVFAILGLAAGCNLSTTDSTAPTGPSYRITSTLKDSAPAGTILSVPIQVTFDGTASASTSVHWILQAGHGKISDTVTTTDSLGGARILWTISSSPEQNALVAAAGDGVDTIRVVSTIGSPSYLDFAGARSDTVGVGSPVTLQVIVRDRPGNAVPGTAVNWSTSGGSLSALNTVSDGTGTETTTFSAGAPGTYQVTANLPERASLFFQIVVH